MSVLEIESGGIKFNVRIVREGDKYGLDNCLTHDKKEALVEFYDTRYPHTEYGQFITRYNINTLLMSKSNQGLDLYGGVPAWKVDAKEMYDVVVWLSAENNNSTKKMKM